jgi:E3 ubiquitin-protein ligase TRIP12
MAVDHTNVEEYIDQVPDAFLGNGAKLPVEAFREGFSKVVPISDLQTFTSDEIPTIFGNPNED